MTERLRGFGFVGTSTLVIIVSGLLLASCGGKSNRPPATVSNPPPPVMNDDTPSPTPRSTPDPVMRDEDMGDNVIEGNDPDDIFSRTIEQINENSPLVDIRYDYDSAQLSPEARTTLERHAEWLNQYTTVTLLVSGHCDERGTVAYNLALGERRAMSAYNYLTSLGIDASRLRTISFGKETPLVSEHNEAAWARNRRGHFEITGR